MPNVRAWIADLHIHSKYSRACSRDLELENLAWWAQRKGITLLGTGDFTHPGWFDHLREHLIPAEDGLFRLRPER
jgi:DNA helicase II / ATP-dependent DNA helicase PcrA